MTTTPGPVLRDHNQDQGWASEGACVDVDTNLFYEREYQRRALAFCATCPVRLECLAYSMRKTDAGTTVTEHGIWGGALEGDRHGTMAEALMRSARRVGVLAEVETCAVCEQVKSWQEFYTYPNGTISSRCRLCAARRRAA